MAHPVSKTRESHTSRPQHSGEGNLATNIVAFAVMFILFAASIYSLTFFERTNVWQFAVCLTLFFLAFWIPQTILGRSDSGHRMAKGDRKA
jgi:ammonia channel protein AmtB